MVTVYMNGKKASNEYLKNVTATVIYTPSGWKFKGLHDCNVRKEEKEKAERGVTECIMIR